ncbi:hypothetical protein JCM10207_001969 [Rhodosporidiobolus poonsookiae]
METVTAVLGWAVQHPYKLAGYALLATPFAVVAYFLVLSVVRPYRSTLRDLPGPPRTHYFWGNLPQIFEEEPGISHCTWANEYGGALRYWAFCGDQRLLLTDPVALNHILLSNAYDYPKPDEVRGDLAMILGKGILFAEGDDHRRQRRIMAPSFGPGHLRELVPTFFERSYKLRDIWRDLIATSAVDENAWKDATAVEEYRASRPKDADDVVLELTAWLNRLTLDIIGTTGFGYEFNALDRDTTPLGTAFGSMFAPRGRQRRVTVRGVLIGRTIGWFIRALPILKIAEWIPNERLRAVREGFRIIERESTKIIESKQNDVVEKDKIESLTGSKDLISLLLRSTGNDSKSSMSDIELRGQLTTFLLAGHETTSTALTWTFHTLSRLPEKQNRLRQEVHAARKKAQDEGRDELDNRELDALPYLDAVTREILRLEAPVTATIRTVAKDDVIPLSAPIPSRADPSRTISSVEIKAGQTIFIPILAVNRNKAIFGPDADDFRPERWLESDEGAGKRIEGNVGTYSSMLTFLAGPRSCIGYRFALLELKAILATLIDDFEFSPRDDDLKVEHRSQIVTRPLIVGEEDKGPRMPIRVRLAKHEE